MPAGDRTGPMGMGPMSGRAAGFCAGSGTPGYASALRGRGPGMAWGRGGVAFGGGRGRGWRHWHHATGLPRWARFGLAAAWGAAEPDFVGPTGAPNKEQEAGHLRSQADWLRQQLDAINQRMAELEKED